MPDILNPGFNLTLRPMVYPELYAMYKRSMKDTWSVDEISFTTDLVDLSRKMTLAEKHMIHRLIAFFATGDTIVANNLVLNLYKHLNSPEARMFLGKQLEQECLHIDMYLTLLDTYIPNYEERNAAFSAIENIPSIKKKGDFCFKWIDSINELDELDTDEKKKKFLLNLICFATCIEGLFFFGAFAYVYFLKSKGLLAGLGTATEYIFREESSHMEFAFIILSIVKKESPHLFDLSLEASVREMIKDAVDSEYSFAEDTLQFGVGGISLQMMKEYLQYVGDMRLMSLGYAPEWKSKNPFPFMDRQDIQVLTNFFETRVSEYQVGIPGKVTFEEDF